MIRVLKNALERINQWKYYLIIKRLYLEGEKTQFTRTNTTAALDEQPEENRLLPSTASSFLKSAPCT